MGQNILKATDTIISRQPKNIEVNKTDGKVVVTISKACDLLKVIAEHTPTEFVFKTFQLLPLQLSRN